MMKPYRKGQRIIFEHLPAYIFEQKLKEDARDNNFSGYYNVVKHISERYGWGNDLFKKLSRNISLVHDSYIEGDEFNRKRCYDLNYWLYDNVYKNLESSNTNDTDYFKDISTKLQGVWKNIVDNEFKGQPFQCYPDKDLLLNMGYLQEVKDLFDFFQDYDDYMKYRPASIVPDLNPLIVLWYPYTPCYQSVYDLFVKAKEQPKRNDGIYKKKMEKLERLNPGGNLLLTDMGDGLRGSEFFIPGDHDDYWLRLKWDILLYITDDITPPLLGIVGVLLILWALYKFTPIGKSVRRTRAKVRKRIRPNINYDDIKLLYGSEESLNSSTDSYDYNNDYDNDYDNDDYSDSNSSYNLSYASTLDY
ncbi:PIR protein [Plasmodium vivax]|uniref:VIR protein n=1 Tax=Plasmodium vivax TaxID=5855 RepID=A0A565A7N4_PLAVI|nr:PIR protein [Plasmodium vivax]